MDSNNTYVCVNEQLFVQTLKPYGKFDFRLAQPGAGGIARQSTPIMTECETQGLACFG